MHGLRRGLFDSDRCHFFRNMPLVLCWHVQHRLRRNQRIRVHIMWGGHVCGYLCHSVQVMSKRHVLLRAEHQRVHTVLRRDLLHWTGDAVSFDMRAVHQWLGWRRTGPGHRVLLLEQRWGIRPVWNHRVQQHPERWVLLLVEWFQSVDGLQSHSMLAWQREAHVWERAVHDLHRWKILQQQRVDCV